MSNPTYNRPKLAVINETDIVASLSAKASDAVDYSDPLAVPANGSHVAETWVAALGVLFPLTEGLQSSAQRAALTVYDTTAAALRTRDTDYRVVEVDGLTQIIPIVDTYDGNTWRVGTGGTAVADYAFLNPSDSEAGEVDVRVKVDVDESGGVSEKKVVDTRLSLVIATDGKTTLKVVVTPYNGAQEAQNIQEYIFDLGINMDAFQTAAGRVRQA